MQTGPGGREVARHMVPSSIPTGFSTEQYGPGIFDPAISPLLFAQLFRAPNSPLRILKCAVSPLLT
jgi:hypothetical protein